jgi:hypothetical protein
MVCDENEVYVHDPPSGQSPATFWSGDRYRCPKCGHQVITGFSKKLPMSHLDQLRVEQALQFTYQ